MSQPHRSSAYVAMRDGVRLAVDVWRAAEARGALPCLLLSTRYWRALDRVDGDDTQQGAYPLARYFTAHGYAVVSVDSRGSGASFGTRRTEWSEEEAADLGEVIEWIVAQPWSNGEVATHGFSYGGNTAFLAAVSGRAALKLVAPQFADFDIYRHNLFPGGVANLWLNDAWAALTSAQDRGDVAAVAAALPGVDPTAYVAQIRGPAPVGGPYGDLAAAIAEHAGNFNIAATGREVVFADDAARLNTGGGVDRVLDAERLSIRSLKPQIEASGVPIAYAAGWFDAGTAEGAIELFNSFSNPMHVVIGPWNHGRRCAQNPLNIGGVPAAIALEDTFADVRAAIEAPPSGRRLDYYVVGAEVWRSTPVWPPQGAETERLYLAKANRLSTSPPTVRVGADPHRCYPSATTGPANRWHTQIGCPPVSQDDRTAQDAKLLVYDGARLHDPLEITGAPVARLWLTVDQPDAAVFVYLEAIAPDGRVALLTEGRLRLMHRKVTPSPFEAAPAHSCRRADALAVTAGELMDVEVRLLPISILVPAGWRLRVAIAGADADTFATIGEAPVFEVSRAAANPSFIEIPTLKAADARGHSSSPTRVQ